MSLKYTLMPLYVYRSLSWAGSVHHRWAQYFPRTYPHYYDDLFIVVRSAEQILLFGLLKPVPPPAAIRLANPSSKFN